MQLLQLKLKALAILLIIILSLIPVCLFNKLTQKITRPKESPGRLFVFLVAGLIVVFVYTFFVVLLIKKLFPGA